jgi:hypothetical protein
MVGTQGQAEKNLWMWISPRGIVWVRSSIWIVIISQSGYISVSCGVARLVDGLVTFGEEPPDFVMVPCLGGPFEPGKVEPGLLC